MRFRRAGARAVAGAAVVMSLALGAACGGGSDRQADVERRSGDVMPFDLELAHFTLDANDQGGIMTISTDSEFRADEIQRVREYLREVQQEFRAGNFEDPETIQGADTPGLAKLAAGAEDLQIAYVDLPDGGRLILRSDRPDLVDAVHRWFDAMLVDFGDRASVPTTRPEPSEDGPPVPDGLLG